MIEKPESAQSLIGQRIPKRDAPEKVNGKARYVHDINLPGQLVGKILRTDRVHARIIAIDVSAARALPGVHAVITAAEVPDQAIGVTRDNPPLKGDRVRCERDEIAAVAAETEEIADTALALITVEYEDLPVQLDAAVARDAGALLIHDDKPGNIALEFDYEHGDVVQGEAESDVVIEDCFSLHYVTHACLGVSGVIADFDDITGNLTLYSNTQVPFLHKR
jgi:xanthine dehydrogenase molybdenum-binding subunit